MKTIAEQLIEAQAALAKAGADLESAGKATLAMAGERDALAAQVKTLTDEKAALVADHGKAIAEVNGKLAAETTAHLSTIDMLAEANKKLADPAYRIASATGDKAGVPEGGVSKSEPDMTQAQALAEYRKLDGKPAEQKAFRVANWRVLGCGEEHEDKK
jgi:hypothetical protein